MSDQSKTLSNSISGVISQSFDDNLNLKSGSLLELKKYFKESRRVCSCCSGYVYAEESPNVIFEWSDPNCCCSQSYRVVREGYCVTEEIIIKNNNKPFKYSSVGLKKIMTNDYCCSIGNYTECCLCMTISNNSIILPCIMNTVSCNCTEAGVDFRKLINYNAFTTCCPCFSHKISMWNMEFENNGEAQFRNDVTKLMIDFKHANLGPEDVEME
jgi:hypothetical protein